MPAQLVTRTGAVKKREKCLRGKGLNTRVKILPLLLCCFSGAAQADGLAPLFVAPDLVRPRVLTNGATVLPGAVTSGEDVRPGAPPAATGVRGEIPLPVDYAQPAKGGSAGTAVSPITGPQAGETEVRALRIVGVRTVELVAEGEAELQRDGVVLLADKVVYNELTDAAKAEGNVRFVKGEDWVTGAWAYLTLHEWVGEINQPRYFIARTTRPATDDEAAVDISGSGHGDTMYLEGENQYRLINATWSTCTPDNPDWYIKAENLQLDYDREVGVAKGGSLVFKDVPVFWWPWMEFPLVAQRQSGLLVPTMGISNKTGLDVSMPYYWNIAPNYDATIAPRYMGRRGLQLAGEFRYMTPTYQGESRVEWLPNDKVTGERRTLAAVQHQQMLAPGLFASLDLNAVSDDQYFEDLSSRLSVASRVNLLREGRLAYGGGWWNATALVQRYQTLSGDEPYRRLPQIRVTANRADLPGGAALAFSSEYVRFDHPDTSRPKGSRWSAYPQLSLPFERPGYYVTPKIGFHFTKYDLDRPLVGGRSVITRSMPVVSLDSGLFFERDTNFFGNDYLQTLEPRVFYVKVPYHDQSDVPVFDSARYDFGFAQIFSEMRYAGNDRIGDANQITAALTTRLIDHESGAERLRATLGQRYHFSDQHVTLNELGRTPVELARTRSRTDVLAAVSSRLSHRTSVETAWQYDPADRKTERFNFNIRYQKDFAKVVNFGYRFSRDVLKDVDISAQWPLGGRWYGVGRITRSLLENRVTEAIAGIEYVSDCGCWLVRAAAHRFATDPNRVTNALFIQLELKGLGSIGSSPVNLLRRSVPGYGKINESISDPFFGAE